MQNHKNSHWLKICIKLGKILLINSLLGNNIADVNICCTSPINQIITCIVKTEKKTLHEFQIKSINPKSNCCIINKKKKVISTNIYL